MPKPKRLERRLSWPRRCHNDAAFTPSEELDIPAILQRGSRRSWRKHSSPAEAARKAAVEKDEKILARNGVEGHRDVTERDTRDAEIFRVDVDRYQVVRLGAVTRKEMTTRSPGSAARSAASSARMRSAVACSSSRSRTSPCRVSSNSAARADASAAAHVKRLTGAWYLSIPMKSPRSIVLFYQAQAMTQIRPGDREEIASRPRVAGDNRDTSHTGRCASLDRTRPSFRGAGHCNRTLSRLRRPDH